MANKADYRSRLFDSFYSLKWKYTHSANIGEYELYSKTARKKYGKYIPSDRNASIIDIACGGGHFLYFLQNEGYKEAVGIDLSREMVVFASGMGIRNVTKGNMFDFLPKKKNSFDMIVANDILEHLTKDEVLDFLDLVIAALKPGGRALFQTINSQSLFGGAARYVDFTHEQGFTSSSLAQVLRAAGFVRIGIFGEKPVAHDVKSALRCFLWGMLEKVFRAYTVIESGTGRGFKKYKNIFEPRMFAVVWKAGDK